MSWKQRKSIKTLKNIIFNHFKNIKEGDLIEKLNFINFFSNFVQLMIPFLFSNHLLPPAKESQNIPTH